MLSSKKGKIIVGVIAALIIILIIIYAFSKILENGKTMAKYAALNDAGISEQDITYIKIEPDFEDFQILYDIEFIADGNKYDYSVKSSNGEIVKKDIETGIIADSAQNSGNVSQEDNNIQTSQGENTQTQQEQSAQTPQAQSDYIGVDKAKEIALNNAGLSENNVVFTKSKLDRDNGLVVYDIEFIQNNMEYEYEIDALTGDILSYDHGRND